MNWQVIAESLKTNRTLTYIDLSWNKVTDVGVQAGIFQTFLHWIFVECRVSQSNSITEWDLEARGFPQLSADDFTKYIQVYITVYIYIIKD